MGDIADVGITSEEAVKPPDEARGAQESTTVSLAGTAFDPSLPQNQIARFHIPGQRDEYVRPIARAAAPAPQAFPAPGIQDAPGWAETPIPRSQQMRSARLFREREADVRAQRGIQAAAEAAELARLEDLRQDPRGIKAAAAEREQGFQADKRWYDYQREQEVQAELKRNTAFAGDMEEWDVDFRDTMEQIMKDNPGTSEEEVAAREEEMNRAQQDFEIRKAEIFRRHGQERLYRAPEFLG